MQAKLGRGLLTFVALFTAIAPFIADWNATHIYNPNWPPHAKFHNGQTMAMGVLLGLAALYFLWRRRGAQSTNLLAAVILLVVYWASQMAAFLFPGVSYIDPEFVGPAGMAAVAPQFILECVALAIIAIGSLLLRPSNTHPLTSPAHT